MILSYFCVNLFVNGIFANSLLQISQEIFDKSSDIVVSTYLGRIKGSIVKSRLNNDIYSFRGIRYAKPPIGKLRFQPPQSIEDPWKGIYDATNEGPACPQYSLNFVEFSEDCLFLNVYTRQLINNFEEPKHSVILFFHEGGFHNESGQSKYAGPEYLLDEKIVLVTINYRLATLGFISTGDKYAPGNLGLKDQVLALKWVHTNIAWFGGDPNSITIFGYGAGAISTSLHLVSPMSKGLFHKAIIMSGSAYGNFPLYKDQLDLAKEQAKILNCPDDSSKNIIECLKTKSVKDISQSYSKLLDSFKPMFFWSPVIENDFGQERFLPDDPNELILRGKFENVPLIIGVNNLEFSYWSFFILKNQTLLNQFETNFDIIAPKSFLYDRKSIARKKEITEQIKFFYLNGTSDNLKEKLVNLGQIYFDSLVGFPVHKLVHLMASKKQSPTYYYKFSYRGMYSNFYLNESIALGPVHKDDLIYILGSNNFPLFKEKEPEVKIVKRFIKLWTNFAKTGNPTPEKNPMLENSIWEAFELSKENYLEIFCHLRMKNNLNTNRYLFWKSIFSN